MPAREQWLHFCRTRLVPARGDSSYQSREHDTLAGQTIFFYRSSQNTCMAITMALKAFSKHASQMSLTFADPLQRPVGSINGTSSFLLHH